MHTMARMTIWKRIDEFTDYEVSDDGRVRFVGGIRKFGHGTRYAPPAERKPQPHPGGYLQVRLNRRNRYVHRLVALAFLAPKDGCDFVNHKDGDKTNNRVENLEWTTVQGNLIHKVRVLGKGQGITHSKAILTESQVREIRIHAGLHREVARKYGVSRTTVSLIKSGKSWAHLT